MLFTPFRSSSQRSKGSSSIHRFLTMASGVFDPNGLNSPIRPATSRFRGRMSQLRGCGCVSYSLARRLVDNHRHRHGLRLSSKRVVVGSELLRAHSTGTICQYHGCTRNSGCRGLFRASTSTAARHPLNWLVVQRYAQSQTFFLLAALLTHRADSSKPRAQRSSTKPGIGFYSTPSSLFSFPIL